MARSELVVVAVSSEVIDSRRVCVVERDEHDRVWVREATGTELQDLVAEARNPHA
jgi:hypothetical protein